MHCVYVSGLLILPLKALLVSLNGVKLVKEWRVCLPVNNAHIMWTGLSWQSFTDTMYEFCICILVRRTKSPGSDGEPKAALATCS